ncbi:MAG: hypothetical protein KAS72_01630 [Phycisphaerales bacterium]|nr:hypothetical protein [Phycisphaerales bacterium]
MTNESIHLFTRALAARGGGIAVCCGLIVLCAVVQLLTWGVVEFTDLRYEHIESAGAEAQPLIVTRPADVPQPTEGTARVFASSDAGPTSQVSGAVDANVAFSKYDIIFSTNVTIARAIALIAAFLLVGQLMLASILAAQARIVGLPRVASATCAAMLLALILIPWGDVFPQLGYPGALPSYQHIVAGPVSQGESAAPWSMIASVGTNLVLPFVVFVLAALIVLRYRIALDEELWSADDALEGAPSRTTESAQATPRRVRAIKQPASPPSPAHASASSSESPPSAVPGRLPREVHSVLDKPLRKPRGMQPDAEPDPSITQPDAKPGDPDRRATQIGSAGPLRRPI